MASEWFCRIAGAELGPLSAQQVKAMAAQGRLHPDDVLRRGSDGPWLPAGRVKGLFPADQSAVEAPAAPAAAEGPAAVPAVAPAESKPPAKKIATPLPIAKQSAAAKPVVAARPAKPAGASAKEKPAGASAKKTPASPPAKDDSASPGESKAASNVEFPAETRWRHSTPKKEMSFDHLAIDTTTPVRIVGRKGSRAGGLTKQERKKATLIIGGVMGVCLLGIGLMVGIWAVFLNGRKAPPPTAPSAHQGRDRGDTGQARGEEDGVGRVRGTE